MQPTPHCQSDWDIVTGTPFQTVLLGLHDYQKGYTYVLWPHVDLHQASFLNPFPVSTHYSWSKEACQCSLLYDSDGIFGPTDTFHISAIELSSSFKVVIDCTMISQASTSLPGHWVLRDSLIYTVSRYYNTPKHLMIDLTTLKGYSDVEHTFFIYFSTPVPF